jgi:hypothetical protein
MEPLCQRGRASCGACCGLYNLRDLSRRAVRQLLGRRTAALRGAERTAAAYREAAAWLVEEAPEPLFPSVRVCAFLGYIDEGEARVGCLAHPLATGGLDLRDCGAYDARTCGAFFCPSHAWLSDHEAEIAAAACAGDPYLYGLVVTDVPFLRAALDGIAALTGARVERRHLSEPRFSHALGRLLALKDELAPGSEGLFGAFEGGPGGIGGAAPDVDGGEAGGTLAGASESAGGAAAGLFGAFERGEDGEPLARQIDYAALDRMVSPYDVILTCVGADPRSGNDLDRLEAEVRSRLSACADAFP